MSRRICRYMRDYVKKVRFRRFKEADSAAEKTLSTYSYLREWL